MPVRSVPDRRRIQQSVMPSAVNGRSTEVTPCHPAQTADETTAAGQKPKRDESPASRKPRIATSSNHGARSTAPHTVMSAIPAVSWATGWVVVPWPPADLPIDVRMGTTTKTVPRKAATHTLTPTEIPPPMVCGATGPPSAATTALARIDATASTQSTATPSNPKIRLWELIAAAS